MFPVQSDQSGSAVEQKWLNQSHNSTMNQKTKALAASHQCQLPFSQPSLLTDLLECCCLKGLSVFDAASDGGPQIGIYENCLSSFKQQDSASTSDHTRNGLVLNSDQIVGLSQL